MSDDADAEKTKKKARQAKHYQKKKNQVEKWKNEGVCFRGTRLARVWRRLIDLGKEEEKDNENEQEFENAMKHQLGVWDRLLDTHFCGPIDALTMRVHVSVGGEKEDASVGVDALGVEKEESCLYLSYG